VQFSNRVALVTGATGALGSAVALDMIANGARVAAPYLSQKEYEDLIRRVGEHQESVFGVKADLTRGDEVERAASAVLERWGRLDYLLAIAGGFAAGKSYETDERTWDHMFNLNLRSVYLVLRAVVPAMIRQNFGRIVLVSSGAILHGGGSGIAAYAISKNAVRQLAEILADELKDYDVHVHCVLPANFSKWVKTEDVARVIRTLLTDDLRAARTVTVPVLG
jgi:NAD(P)-dependent dehydrogenase (short-subunit alcohol dehydrogenase family)